MVKVKFKDEEFSFKINSVKEAIDAICANRKQFKKFFGYNNYYKVIVDGKTILHTSQYSRKGKYSTIEIVPVLIGCSSNVTFGVIQIVLGAALIAAGAIIAAGSAGALTPLAAPAIIAGIALLATGVITLLTPVPSFDTTRGSGRASTFFSGSDVNTVTQGIPVPVIYGELIEGSFVVSALLRTFDDDGDYSEQDYTDGATISLP